MVTVLLGAEAALDGGSEAVHGLPGAADPLAHRVDRAPEGPHDYPPPAAAAASPPVGARRRQPRARKAKRGLMASGGDGEGRGEMSQKAMAAGGRGVGLQERERKGGRPNSSGLGPSYVGRFS